MPSLAFSAEVSSAEFQALVRRASSVQGKTSVPILDFALLKGDGQTLTVSATNLDQAVTAQIPCGAQGSCTASIARLSSIASALEKGATVQMSVNGTGELTVRQGRSRYAMPTLPVDDYPALGEASGVEITAPAADLARSLRDLKGTTPRGKAATAMAYLCGVFFDCRNGALAATDGNTLGRDIAPWCRANRDGFTLPNAAHGAVLDICAMGDSVQIIVDETAATFSAGGVKAWTKFIGVPFPDYGRLIPTEFSHKWRVATPDLIRALKRVAMIDKTGEHGAEVRAQFGANEISFASRDLNSSATAETAVTCERLTGDDARIGFSSALILWAADALDGEAQVDIMANSATLPVVLTPANSTDAIRLVVPRKIAGL